MSEISLITTTRNRPHLILGAALNVAKQTREPDEWLLYIDDNISEYDGTFDRIRKLCPYVNIQGGEPVGRVKALAEAHRLATFNTYGWYDDDDWMDPNCIEECEKVQRPFVYTQYWSVTSEGRLSRPRCNDLVFHYDKEVQRFKGIPFHFRLYDRELFDDIGGFDLSFEAAIDSDLFGRMAFYHKPYKVEKPLYYYRLHSARMSYHLREEQKRCRARVEKWLLDKYTESV